MRHKLCRSFPGLGSSKVLVLGTWCKISSTCTWHFEIQKYLVLTCTWRQSTWYLSKYFQVFLSNQHVYSGLNLEYVSFNKSPLNTIVMNYWYGSYCVLTAWGLQTSRLDCLPWSAGQEYLKSLAHGRWGCDLRLSIFKFISRIDILGISCDTIPFSWRPQDLTDNWWTLIQVMAWCHQEMSHYLSKC